jgi:hypothetical protein
MLRQALSARSSAIDRARLADQTVERSRRSGDSAEAQPAPVTWTAIPVARRDPAPTGAAEVPDVIGLDVRAAAALLHRRGFRVRLEGTGWVRATDPVSGDSASIGKAVLVTAADRQR